MSDNFKRAPSSEPKANAVIDSKLSPGYIKFTKDNKKFWVWFNLLGMVFNLLFGIFSLKEIKNANNDCGGLKGAVYSLIVLYGFNFVLQAMSLCGLEKRLCNSLGLLFCLLFNAVVLVTANCLYF